MGVKRVVAFALNGEDRTGNFVLQVQGPNALGSI
jgi:hypothetical protein